MGNVSPDISRIRALVARARRRLRTQAALEGATTAVVLASAAALAAVYAVRAYIVTPSTGVLLLVGTIGMVAAGAVIRALARPDDEAVARRIDRASNLADRLSTAIAFEDALRSPAGAEAHDPEVRDLMRAAIRDGVGAVPRANVEAATPFHAPRDLRPAAVFAAIGLLAAGLGLPTRDPKLVGVDPMRAARGETATVLGEWLCGPDADGPRAASDCPRARHHVALGTGQAMPIAVWTGGTITVSVPDDAPIGKTTIQVRDGDDVIGALAFEVVDRAREKADRDGVVLDDDDRSYTEDLLKELEAQAQRDQIPELQKYVDEVRKLLEQAEKGELSKEELLDKLKQAESELSKGEEPDQEQVDKDLSDTGKELEKNELTKELGKALEENDLEKAKQEMEKLAEKMDKGELTEKQKQDLAKAMEKAAKEFEKKQEQRDKDQQAKIDKAEKEVRRLEKEKDQAKTPQQKEDAERRLEKKKRELQQLQKQKEQQEQSEQRRALKRLHKDMEDAAKDLQKKQEPQEQQGENDGQKQASEKMKQAAEETGRVDKDQRKTAAQKKVASQMDDLREALRRAKRKGNQGPKNPFGKNGKQSDFEKRARGQRGSKGAWKPGQGKGKGEGENGGDANGDPQASNTWGTGHDDNLTGDPTDKSGDDKDQDLQGVHGKGPSRRETILSAAQKGFASKGYEQVYQDYKRIVEEVMRSEKVPSSYKYYIKKYFTKIKPHAMD